MSLFKRAYNFSWRRWRVLHYRILSTNVFTGIAPQFAQPVLFKGEGTILFEGPCFFGWVTSPGFYNTYAYIEAREKGSRIIFGGGSCFNNGFHIVAGAGEIRLGKNLMVGVDCSISNSDFHNVTVKDRNTPPFPGGDVVVGDNVFIGNKVTILKGVTIGDNSTIGSGAVVTSDIPANCIAAGVPARVLKQLDV